MHNGIKERCYSYFSGIYNPIYEQYKLKNDSKYARQRFSSLEALSKNFIHPMMADYDLRGCGMLSDYSSLEKMIEDVIDAKNSCCNNSVSVGDVIKVFRSTNRYFYYVDPVGLIRLSVF